MQARGGITNFNISVAIMQQFMDAYKYDQECNLVDPLCITAEQKVRHYTDCI